MHLIPSFASLGSSLIASLAWSLGFVLGMFMRGMALILVFLKAYSVSLRQGFDEGFHLKD